MSGAASVDAAETIAAVRAAIADDLHADCALELIDAWASASSLADTDAAGARNEMRTLIDGLLGVAL